MPIDDTCAVAGFCELLHEVSSLCAKRQTEALSRGGLAVAEFGLLSALSEEPDAKLESLAHRLAVSRGRLTRILDALEKKDLVSRRRDETDHRKVVLEITPRGMDTLARAALLRGEAGGALLAAMSSDEQERLLAGLRLLRDMMKDPADGEATTRMTGDEKTWPESV